jgi:hypothetical protein
MKNNVVEIESLQPGDKFRLYGLVHTVKGMSIFGPHHVLVDTPEGAWAIPNRKWVVKLPEE